MFEKASEPLLAKKLFYKRLRTNLYYAAAILLVSLAIGIMGYHILGGLNYVDSFLNASMILGGMGPVDLLQTKAAKIFAGCYALFSGITFLSTFAVLVSPVLHRFLHQLHASSDEDVTKTESKEEIKEKN